MMLLSSDTCIYNHMIIMKIVNMVWHPNMIVIFEQRCCLAVERSIYLHFYSAWACKKQVQWLVFNLHVYIMAYVCVWVFLSFFLSFNTAFVFLSDCVHTKTNKKSFWNKYPIVIFQLVLNNFRKECSAINFECRKLFTEIRNNLWLRPINGSWNQNNLWLLPINGSWNQKQPVTPTN